MNVRTQVDHLGLRMSDAGKGKFPDSFKRRALENSQYILANLLNHGYLSNLEYQDTNVAVSSGVMAFSSLTYKVAKGEEGILTVKQYGGDALYATEIKEAERKVMENSDFNATLRNPYYCVIGESIYVYPTSITAVDVTYLRQPSTLRNKFTYQSTPTASDNQFVGDAAQGLSSTNDYYNGSVIYSINHNTYHRVADYIGATRYFTLLPALTTGVFDDDEEFYFITNGFDELTLTGVTSDLNKNLHTLMIDLAEAECWAMAGNHALRTAALDTAMKQIVTLNEAYTEAAGIGTKVGG